jgi:3-isopropylmalate dehydrogenase
MQRSDFQIAVFPGDGIGIEVMDACFPVLQALERRHSGLRLRLERLPGGAGTYRETGVALPEEALRTAERADAILFGAMGLPNIRYPNGTEIAPQIELRNHFQLFAGVRPIRSVKGIQGPLGDPRAAHLDFVIIREQTEGLFASHALLGKSFVENDAIARDTMVITREATVRVSDFAFALARSRKAVGSRGAVSLVDKANAFVSFAFFRKVFDERAALHPDIEASHVYIDAMALNLVKQPWNYDVIVTENMFGDILSDLGAALVGGMGFAPSADIGEKNAVFQPAHGTAPDIVGTGRANPTAMFLSAAMMLDWLGERQGAPALVESGRDLRDAVDRAFALQQLRPFEAGGSDGTAAITRAVISALGV